MEGRERGVPNEVATAKEERSRRSSSSSSSSSSCSPVSTVRHQKSGTFQRWRRQMQRAWRWGASGSSEHVNKTTVNFELMANQKRQWYQIHSRPRDHKQQEPTSLFEHFFIVGLHSHANVEVIEDASAKRKIWGSDVKSEIHHHGHSPLLEPQILFKYPPGKKLATRERDLPAFCFPGGVKVQPIHRTPSMSELNEVVFGQEHLARDDLSFIFCLKDSDNATLYGVCLHVQEIVQRVPGILGAISRSTRASGKLSRFLVSAPRCYCILTRVPFFEFHYEMLNSIIAQERLDRITQFVNEMALADDVPRGVREHRQIVEKFDPRGSESLTNWMDSIIPIDSNYGLAAASGSISSDGDIQSSSFRSSDVGSPESITTSEASDHNHTRFQEKDLQRNLHCMDEFASEVSEIYSLERLNASYENGEISPSYNFSTGNRLECIESLEPMYRSVRSTVSDGDDEPNTKYKEIAGDDEPNMKYKEIAGDAEVLEWAMAKNNGCLQIVCSYHSLPLPSRGNEIVFHPLEHLQPILYRRPTTSSLGLSGTYSSRELSHPSEIDVNAKLAATEEALALSIWTTATICRVLSLESVLTLLTGALLEKQVVIVCPNLGVLSAVVLSLIPLIQPFEWQSLLLPVLPRKMFDFLDAPVPYIVGIQHKPVDLKLKATNLMYVNIDKDNVKTCQMPMLPRYRELFAELSSVHAILSSQNSIAKQHPVYKCSEVQAEAAERFKSIVRCYMESICSNLHSHTITNVQSNNDRVSLLLKESFIGSFPTRDRPFIKLFSDTQLFSVLSDSKLSSFENRPF